ncbi:MAG: hypothetical protein ACYC61_05065 [Isosphaeraceae bacterium]
MSRARTRRVRRRPAIDDSVLPQIVPTAPDPLIVPLHCQLAETIGSLPKDLAVMLISLGVVGVAIPGPIPPGASFILLGTVILWPSVLVRTGGPLAHRFPRVFRMLINFANDLHEGLDRRYPGSRRV